MLRYIIKRFFLMFFMIFTIVSFLYLSFSIVIWTRSFNPMPFHLFLPRLVTGYLNHLKEIIFHWNWGIAYNNQDAWELFVFRAPRSLRILVVTYALSLSLGLILGISTGFFKHTIFDKIIAGFTLIFGSIPNFVLLFIFMLYFGYHLKWFPPIPPPDSDGMVAVWRSVIIPVMALSLMPIAKITSMMRSEFKEIYESEYALLLKTKGLNNTQMIARHHFKNAIIPILPEIAHTFNIVLTSSFILEKINNTAGIASLLFNSLFSPIMDAYFFAIDINTAVLVCTFYTVVSMVFMFIVDVLVAFLDPRIKIGAK